METRPLRVRVAGQRTLICSPELWMVYISLKDVTGTYYVGLDEGEP